VKRIRINKRWRKYHCPFCSAVVYLDDTNLKTYHQGAKCEQWNRLCEQMSGHPTELGILIDPKGSNAND